MGDQEIGQFGDPKVEGPNPHPTSFLSNLYFTAGVFFYNTQCHIFVTLPKDPGLRVLLHVMTRAWGEDSDGARAADTDGDDDDEDGRLILDRDPYNEPSAEASSTPAEPGIRSSRDALASLRWQVEILQNLTCIRWRMGYLGDKS